MPGALLGGLADEFTTSYKPLLPVEDANEADVECAQQFIDLERFFMENAPVAPGFRRFYCVLLQARRAIMLDLSRATRPFDGMEAVNAHFARILVDYAITAARPAGEAKMRELLETQGHKATASIFNAIKEDKYMSIKPKSEPKKMKKQGTKRGGVYFPGVSSSTPEGSELNESSCESTIALEGCDRLDVESLGGVETTESSPESSRNIEVRSQSGLGQTEDGLSPIEVQSETPSSCRRAHRSWRLHSSREGKDCMPNVCNSKARWGDKGDSRSEAIERVVAPSPFFSPWDQRHDGSCEGELLCSYDRSQKGILSGSPQPKHSSVCGGRSWRQTDCCSSPSIRTLGRPIYFPDVHSIRSEAYKRSHWRHGRGVPGRLLPFELVHPGTQEDHSIYDFALSAFGLDNIREECLGTKDKDKVLRFGMRPRKEVGVCTDREEAGVQGQGPEVVDSQTNYAGLSQELDWEVGVSHSHMPNRKVAHQEDPEVYEENARKGESRDSIGHHHRITLVDADPRMSNGGVISSGTNFRDSPNRRSQNSSGLHLANRWGDTSIPEHPHNTESIDTPQQHKRDVGRLHRNINPCPSVEEQTSNCMVRQQDSFIPPNEVRISKVLRNTASDSREMSRVVCKTQHPIDSPSHSGNPEHGSRPSVEASTGLVSPRADCERDYDTYRATRTGQVWSSWGDNRPRSALARLERFTQPHISPTILDTADSGQGCPMGRGGRHLRAPSAMHEPRSGNYALLAEDQLGFTTLSSIISALETEVNPGGGLVDGTSSKDKLAAEISHIIGDIRSAIETRALSPGVRVRRIRATEQFLKNAANYYTKCPEDSLILYAFRLLGSKSGNVIFRDCLDIVAALKCVQIKMGPDIHRRISEVCRYGNLMVPPESRSADPVSLKMIYYLFDRANEQDLPNAQCRALDILLIAYSTMCRMGEICQLKVQDVTGKGNSDYIRISFVQKQQRRKGTRTVKVVPAALGRNSWCPRRILCAWRDDAIENNRTFIFGGSRDIPPSVQGVDKALAAVLSKLAPDYPLRITGHSARKGAALEACALGIPQPIIQCQGGWADPATCSKYMGSGWTKLASTFTVVERATCSRPETGDHSVRV